MTEKRFTISDTDVLCMTIIDNENGKHYGFARDIAIIMNELHDENKELKKEYNSLQRTVYKIDAIAYEDREYSERLYKQNQQLEKEISKLKCINKQLEDRLENSGIGIALDMEECE